MTHDPQGKFSLPHPSPHSPAPSVQSCRRAALLPCTSNSNNAAPYMALQTCTVVGAVPCFEAMARRYCVTAPSRCPASNCGLSLAMSFNPCPNEGSCNNKQCRLFHYSPKNGYLRPSGIKDDDFRVKVFCNKGALCQKSNATALHCIQ